MKKLIIPGCVCIIGILLLSGCNQQFIPFDPQADIKMDINEGAAPLTVQFKGDGSSDSDGGGIVSYFWDFGDGSTSTLANPSHTFERDGGYSIRLMVTDDEGVTDNETDSVYVFSDYGFSSSVINVSADSYVSSADPDSNHGSETILQASGDYYSYLKFTDLPSDATIVDAKLKLYTTHEYTTSVEIVVYFCSDNSWVEDEITWNNKPLNSIGVLDRITIYDAQDWFSWDITDEVIDALSEGTITLVLVGATDQVAQFFSKDSGTDYVPMLMLQIDS